LTDYRKYSTKTINPLAISTKISSLVATENYCKWNRNILVSTPFLSGMTACSTVACISKRHVWHHKTTDSPPSLVTICHKSGDPFPSSGCDVIYGRPPSPKFVCKISTVAMSWMYTSTIATKANAFRTRFICCGRLTLRQYWRDVLCSPGANIARPTQQNSAGEEHRPFNRNAVGVVSGSMHWRSSLWQTLRWPLAWVLCQMHLVFQQNDSDFHVHGWLSALFMRPLHRRIQSGAKGAEDP